jgi:hypothetical protein
VKSTDEEYLHSLDTSINEKKWQQEVTGGFPRLFPCVYHTFNSRNSPKGFPDTIVPVPPSLWFYRDKPPPLIVIELKVGNNKPTGDQLTWLMAFATTGAWTFVLWPRHRPVLNELYAANWGSPKIRERMHVYTKRG